MKRTPVTIVLAIAVSVFLLSFLAGRATALRDREKKEKQSEIYEGTVHFRKEEAAPAGAAAVKVPREEAVVEENNHREEAEKKENPPDRMLFPAGQAVTKGYSQTAVYSKTMDDWRAHTGIDYGAEKGSEVVSAWDGTVTKVYKDKLWGYSIEILHTGNIYSIYRNLSKKTEVKEGDYVKKGQIIGKVGDSAAVEKREEPHLHFELWTGGEPINPEAYVY